MSGHSCVSSWIQPNRRLAFLLIRLTSVSSALCIMVNTWYTLCVLHINMHLTSDKNHLMNKYAAITSSITDDCPEILTFPSPHHLISPLTLNEPYDGLFWFLFPISNPLPVALHDGQAQYCAWHLQRALVGASFPSSVLCDLQSVTRMSSKSNQQLFLHVFTMCGGISICYVYCGMFKGFEDILVYCA